MTAAAALTACWPEALTSAASGSSSATCTAAPAYVYIINSAGESIMMDKSTGRTGGARPLRDFTATSPLRRAAPRAGAGRPGRRHRRSTVSRDGNPRTTYEPIGYNNWFICYAVPEENSQQPYAFIRDYEIALPLVVAGLIILLAVLQYTNVRDRKLLEVKAQTDAMTGLLNAVS